MLAGCLIVALAISFLRESQLLAGGTTGLAFLIHYLGGWPLGAVLFVVNLPFYVFAWRAMGRVFTLKTFAAVALLSLFTELVPRLLVFGRLDPVFAAIMAGLLTGIGILILIRHGASLGGIGVMALHLQKTRGWRAGTVQMAFDVVILGLGLLAVPLDKLLLSVLCAMVLNLVIAVNHRPGRYFGY
ncbi:MAG: YitT family protein [Thauera phenolivorans]|uniref:YitT family protein n=1 Tax=Thauera phenolivorans TaxID=1792543 RepID=A0A7X7LWP5_9RHOO|nr:YitT family protein [Thauera phenolivorans]